jgi:hypothetical protein
MSAFKYLKQIKGTSAPVRVDREPVFGKIDGYADYYLDGKWYEPNGHIADGSTNLNTVSAVPKMTSNTAPSGIVTASSVLVGGTAYEPYLVFDGLGGGNTSSWFTATDTTTGYLQYEDETPKTYNKYSMIAPASYLARMAKDWTLEASQTGLYDGEEVVLDTQTAQTGWVVGEPRYYSYTNSTAYKFHRFVITANNGDVSYVGIGELKLIEAEVNPAQTAYITEQTYYRHKFEVIDGEVVNIHDWGYPSTIVDMLHTKKNVKIVDFGTVFNNNRYVIDNPFGNENYEGCEVRAEIFHNGMWSETGWGDNTDISSNGYGVAGFSNLEGLVIQTGVSAVLYTKAEGQGSGFGLLAATLLNSPCRAIVTYIGEATDA